MLSQGGGTLYHHEDPVHEAPGVGRTTLVQDLPGGWTHLEASSDWNSCGAHAHASVRDDDVRFPRYGERRDPLPSVAHDAGVRPGGCEGSRLAAGGSIGGFSARGLQADTAGRFEARISFVENSPGVELDLLQVPIAPHQFPGSVLTEYWIV